MLVKAPVPLPSDVLAFEMVGFAVVAQQMPRAVIVAPPSELILPPLTADALVTELAASVALSTDKVATGAGGGGSVLPQAVKISKEATMANCKIIFMIQVLM